MTGDEIRIVEQLAAPTVATGSFSPSRPSTPPGPTPSAT